MFQKNPVLYHNCFIMYYQRRDPKIIFLINIVAAVLEETFKVSCIELLKDENTFLVILGWNEIPSTNLHTVHFQIHLWLAIG